MANAKSKLFNNYKGEPIKFYLSPCKQSHGIINDIRKHGGRLVSRLGPHTVHLSTQDWQAPVFSSSYVRDCVRMGHLLPLGDYCVQKASGCGEELDPFEVMMGQKTWDSCIPPRVRSPHPADVSPSHASLPCVQTQKRATLQPSYAQYTRGTKSTGSDSEPEINRSVCRHFQATLRSFEVARHRLFLINSDMEQQQHQQSRVPKAVVHRKDEAMKCKTDFDVIQAASSGTPNLKTRELLRASSPSQEHQDSDLCVFEGKGSRSRRSPTEPSLSVPEALVPKDCGIMECQADIEVIHHASPDNQDLETEEFRSLSSLPQEHQNSDLCSFERKGSRSKENLSLPVRLCSTASLTEASQALVRTKRRIIECQADFDVIQLASLETHNPKTREPLGVASSPSQGHKDSDFCIFERRGNKSGSHSISTRQCTPQPQPNISQTLVPKHCITMECQANIEATHLASPGIEELETEQFLSASSLSQSDLCIFERKRKRSRKNRSLPVRLRGAVPSPKALPVSVHIKRTTEECQADFDAIQLVSPDTHNSKTQQCLGSSGQPQEYQDSTFCHVKEKGSWTGTYYSAPGSIGRGESFLSFSSKRTFFKGEEDFKILKYIDERRAFHHVKDAALWKEMALHMSQGRSWKSLKRRFFKGILCKLSSYSAYGLSKRTLARFRHYLSGPIDLELSRELPLHHNKRYSYAEDFKILNFIIRTNSYSKVGGEVLWKLMAADELSCRSWQGLKYRFNSYIIKNLNKYIFAKDQTLFLKKGKCQ